MTHERGEQPLIEDPSKWSKMDGDNDLEKKVNSHLTCRIVSPSDMPPDECLSEARHIIVYDCSQRWLASDIKQCLEQFGGEPKHYTDLAVAVANVLNDRSQRRLVVNIEQYLAKQFGGPPAAYTNVATEVATILGDCRKHRLVFIINQYLVKQFGGPPKPFADMAAEVAATLNSQLKENGCEGGRNATDQN